MSLIKNTPDEYFDKAIELMDQLFREANYSENAIYYDLAGRCLDMVRQEQKDGGALQIIRLALEAAPEDIRAELATELALQVYRGIRKAEAEVRAKAGTAWIAQAFEELRHHAGDAGPLINPTGEITISRTGTLLSVTLQGNALDNVLRGGPRHD